MILLAGLGNPGPKYAGHRHNVGMMAVDAIATHYGLAAERQRFRGLTRDGLIAGRKVVALKPQTFMNESGRSVGEAARFFKLDPEQVVIFHDELDLPPGKVRVKIGGGLAGHNGLKSIQSHIGADFRRVRIGIGHPGSKDQVSPYVLSDFAKADRQWLNLLLDAIARAAEMLVLGDDAGFQNRVAAAILPDERPVKAGAKEK